MSLPQQAALNRIALEPQKSVVIEACAGSGKTWLLVSRIVRLLLAGAKPAEILAITFTRKAAQEMAARLREWLELLATADDDTVRAFLREREVPPVDVDALLPRARGLHEAFLTAQPSVTLSTFHSWFMQLLRRAPLDAGAPGDVTLVEQTSTFVAEAWQLFGRSARRSPEGPAARGLDHLHAQCGVDGTRKLLERFLGHRADWWALTAGRQGGAAVAHVLAGLRATMRVAPDDDVQHLLVTESRFAADLADYVRMLARNTPTDQARAAAFPAAGEPAAVFGWAREALLKKDGDPRLVKPSAAQRKRLGGDAAESAFSALHARLAERLLAAIQDLADQASYRLNDAALHAGAELLDAYQRAKAQRQVIDYADVEWRACELVARSDHALYMQFKLDARYRHVLLDEFQDTNPLQWITLEAWFGAAAEAGLHPTVFLVGDPKQSIYRFRRAEPRLFDAAALWLKERFGATRLTQDASRRCAPQIIGMVNRVFAGLAGYNEHTAHYTTLPGRVEVLPLVARAPDGNDAADVPDALRNPLQSPRTEAEDGRREQEALQMAQRIGEIVARWRIVDDAHVGTMRPARYADVMVLVRRRTHLAVYERALRHAAIPFVTSRQGGLLDTLEARDLLALLRFLVSPFDDLSLAHALRSPVFGCEDTDLQALAGVGAGTWWERLRGLASADETPGCVDPACPAALSRAHRLLAGLLARADTLPVHDQLDRLYFEADVIARYEAAVPAAMRATVTANLRAFMQHALDTDSGRYPSLPRFIDELGDLANAPAEEAPDEGIVGDVGDAVRILTVHGAKGLEAPVVWLPDTAAGVVRDQGYDVVVDWPPEAPAPEHLSVWGRQDARSAEQRRIAEVERDRAARENSNLLYVAITRARQVLIVSGVETRGADASWYRRLRDAAVAGAAVDDEGSARVVLGADLDVVAAAAAPVSVPVEEPPAAIDPRMKAPLPTGARRDAATTRGQRYGTLFHALMERLTEAPDTGHASLREMLGIADAELAPLYAQAQHLLRSPDLAPFFDPARYVRALNELPYADESGTLRRIDRLVEHTDAWWVLDYKTGRAATVRGTELEQQYREQVAEYCAAMRRISGGKPVRGVLLFTDGGRIDV
jgi:ATP-dependent helicase/nuclease subunit A